VDDVTQLYPRRLDEKLWKKVLTLHLGILELCGVFGQDHDREARIDHALVPQTLVSGTAALHEVFPRASFLFCIFVPIRQPELEILQPHARRQPAPAVQGWQPWQHLHISLGWIRI